MVAARRFQRDSVDCATPISWPKDLADIDSGPVMRCTIRALNPWLYSMILLLAYAPYGYCTMASGRCPYGSAPPALRLRGTTPRPRRPFYRPAEVLNRGDNYPDTGGFCNDAIEGL